MSERQATYMHARGPALKVRLRRGKVSPIERTEANSPSLTSTSTRWEYGH